MESTRALLERKEGGPDARLPMAPDTHNTILHATGLTKQFSGFVVINDASISVRKGSIHALIGPNGAGKTTMFNLLSGFIPPTQGKIVFDDTDITNMEPAAVARRGLVRSFQISATFGHLSVHENVRVALQRQASLASQFWRSDAILRRLNKRTDELLEEVNLSRYRNIPAINLSYGRKRILELATTLALEPKLLLLDEPMAGLAHEDIDGVIDMIRRASVGRSVLMVEHNLSVVQNLCDTITVLQRGTVIAEGNYQDVSTDPQVREAYIGKDEEE